MRELKFRAYDKVEKEMLTILEMDWYPDRTLRYLKAIDKDGKERYYDSPDDIIEDLTIEQFAGLKDKNSNDIYEGDLLTIKYSYDNELGQVEWSDKDTRFILAPTLWKITNKNLQKIATKAEVTGNIHEGSQLLEAE